MRSRASRSSRSCSITPWDSTLITAPTLALYTREFLFSFMLPLFAFLSGYVLGRPGRFRARSYFVRRTLGLLVPYLCWEIIYGVLLRQEARHGAGSFGIYLADTFLEPASRGSDVVPLRALGRPDRPRAAAIVRRPLLGAGRGCRRGHVVAVVGQLPPSPVDLRLRRCSASSRAGTSRATCRGSRGSDWSPRWCTSPS